MNTAQSPIGRNSSQKLAVVLWIGTILFAIGVCVRAAVVAAHVEPGWQIIGDHFLAGLPIANLRGEPVNRIEQSTQMLLELARRTDSESTPGATDEESKRKENRGAAALLDARLRWNYQFDLRDVGSAMWRVAPVDQPPLVRIKRVVENDKRKASWPTPLVYSKEQQQFDAMFSAWSDEQWLAERELRQVKGWSIAAVACAACGWLLVAVGLAAAVLHRALRTELARDTRGFVWSIAAWWLGLFVTFGVLGLLVSYRPTVRQYSTLQLAIAATLFGAAVAGFFWLTFRYVRRQRKLPADERAGTYHAARLAIALSATFLAIFPLLCVVDRKVRVGIAATWRDFPGNLLELLLRDLPIDVWGRNAANALLQWGIHGGLFLTAGLWILAVCFASWRSIETLKEIEGPTRRNRLREVVARTSQTVFRSAALLTLLMFALCLAAATQWLACSEDELQKQSARLQNPNWLIEEVAAAGGRLQLPSSVPPSN